MIYLLLAYEFFKIGMFSFGGGYATIPFLYHISEIYNWYTHTELTQMIAIASITPGPVGINVATYAGLKSAGFYGALVATVAEVIPSLILVILIAKILKKFNQNFYVKTIIESLKPISCALLTYVAFNLFNKEIRSLKALILLALLFLISWKNKKSPLFYIVVAGVYGIIISYIN